MRKTADWAVIWDVDGTLVDTAELHYAAWRQLAAERNLPFSRADFEATFGRRNPEILRELFGDHLREEELAALGDRKEELYRAAARRGVSLLPGVRELLAALHALGVPQAVGSSAPRANLELILELTGTAQYFSVVVAMEDTDRGKPDPQVFLIAAARLGLPPSRCVVIEDAVAGVVAAKAAGMKCVAVGGHHNAEKLKAAGADLVVENLQALSAADLCRLIDAGDSPPGHCGGSPRGS